MSVAAVATGATVTEVLLVSTQQRVGEERERMHKRGGGRDREIERMNHQTGKSVYILGSN